ncbi:CDP-glycerol glycerophosphotransferase family protein [Thalassotalea piscium]
MKAKRYLFYISQNYSFAILRPLQKVILERGDEVAWFVEGNSVNCQYFDKSEIVLSNINDVFEYQAIATLYPANIAPTFLPGINVAIFHGFDAGKVDKKGRNDHYKVRNCFDLYCTQGPESTNKFKALAKSHGTFSVKQTGWCALDPLYSNVEDKLSNNTRKTILFCSTFSKSLSCAPILFDTIKKLCEKQKWNWLIQFHPKMEKTIIEKYKSLQNDYLTFVETDNVVPLLKKSDVMVCDTSSVLIMFLLQNKPVVTFNNISPKDYMLNISRGDMLEDAIEKALLKESELMKNIERFITDTHPYSDGNSSERVLDAIDEFLQNDIKNLKAKPVDLIRNFKMRKKLNYWKFW